MPAPFVPVSLPLESLDYKRLIGLVGDANAKLSEYNGLLQAMINPAILLSPLTNQESVLSSKIEGTQATIDEVLQHDAGQKFFDDKEKDIQEIINYRSAIMQSYKDLADRPLSLNFIKMLHAILMDSVRGREKNPGQFRKEQNWIGLPGCTMDTAKFVPPSPYTLMDHLENWINYVHLNEVDPLVQVAIIHAQFEIIHPFLDGNGRIGRLLIPLFLFHKKRISEPMFYLSEYLEKNRTQYYHELQEITSRSAWDDWIVFFLNAIREQSVLNIDKTKKIMAIYEELKYKIPGLTKSQYANNLLDFLFEKPVFNISNLTIRHNIPKATAPRLVKAILDAGIIEELRPAAGRTSATYWFPRLLAVVR